MYKNPIPLVKNVCLTLVLAALILGGGLLSCAQHGRQPSPKHTDQYRSRMAASMRQAARKAGVTINTDKMMVATRGDILIANAPIIEEGGTFLFTYLSFGNTACASRLPADFYTLEAVTDPTGGRSYTRFKNSNGQIVLTAPMERHEREARPEEEGKLEVGIQLRHIGEHTDEHAQALESNVAATTIFGVCRCEWIPPFRWRRLHSVII